MSIILPDNQLLTADECFVGVDTSKTRYVVRLYDKYTIPSFRWNWFGRVLDVNFTDARVKLIIVPYAQVDLRWKMGAVLEYDDGAKTWKLRGVPHRFSCPEKDRVIRAIEKKHGITIIKEEEVRKGFIFKRTVKQCVCNVDAVRTFCLPPADEVKHPIYFTQPYTLLRDGI